ADTELSGTIAGGTKSLVLFNPLGEVRDAETTLTVKVAWRDLRPGLIGDGIMNPLYQQSPPGVTPSAPGFIPGQATDDDPVLGVPISPYSVAPGSKLPPQTVLPNGKLAPADKYSPDQKDRVLVQSMASFRPELGESLGSARFKMVQRMARQ